MTTTCLKTVAGVSLGMLPPTKPHFVSVQLDGDHRTYRY